MSGEEYNIQSILGEEDIRDASLLLASKSLLMKMLLNRYLPEFDTQQLTITQRIHIFTLGGVNDCRSMVQFLFLKKMKSLISDLLISRIPI